MHSHQVGFESDIRPLFRDKDVQQYVFMTEAWTVLAADEDAAAEAVDRCRTGQGLKDHPDRREIVMLQAEDKTGKTLGGMYYILRPEHGPPVLSPLHMMDDEVITRTGLLTGMLTERSQT